MATNRVLQLLRSSNVYPSKQDAIDSVKRMTGADGEIRIARYNAAATGEDEDIKSLLCVYHVHPSSPEGKSAGWTFIEDASSSDAGLGGLKNEVDQIEASVGLGTDGIYASPSDGTYVGQETTNTVKSDIAALDTAVNGIQTAINAMNKNENYGDNDTVTSDGKVITAVKQVNGRVSALSADFSDVKIAGYSKNANATGALAATDSLENALSKLENTIAANNTANTVVSSDESITVGTVASGADAGKTNVIVNVDNATIVKDSTSHAIKTNLKIAEVVTGAAGTDEIAGALDTNVEKAYVLVDGSGHTYGKQIDIYKDSAVKAVKLSTVDATWDSTNNVIADGSGADALALAYTLSDGSVQVVTINVADFLRESEFGDGLQVNSGRVSVKKDTTSGKVRIANAPTSGEDTGLVDVLTVSSNGVKVDNIQTAINYAVQNASSDLAVSAAGDSVYIAAAVDANDNKKINVTGTYGAFNTPTAADNTLSATTNGIAKAEDVATAVNTVVGNLDGSATATAASGDVYTVLTSVTETDGVITKGGEVTLAAVAKTGAAADVTVAAGQTSGLAAGNVQDTLEALKTSIDGGLDSVSSGNGAIAVGTKTNKDQSISLILDGTTQGNGHENTGTDNALTITNNGLFLSTTWDCGVY